MADYTINTTGSFDQSETKKLYAKIFGFMSIGLLITFVISLIISLIFQFGFNMYYDASLDVLVGSEEGLTIFLGLLVGSSILQLILTLIISFTCLRSGRNLLIPAILYTVTMGVLVASFGMLMPWYYIVAAFGITFFAFLGMALIGILSKRNLSALGFIGFGLLFATMLISLGAVLFYIFAPALFNFMYVGISLVIVVALLLITAYDVWNIKKIIEKGQMSNNIALYCAFTLYVDFIAIFIRILSIIANTRN